ncbi:sigma-54 dependent transcriptional regulator [Tepidimonas sp.]|uniref:sigma-54-dependent transcriptional regulator n=1 Tax=Tepidimonas sp. TaxID=2002775 RepID=UPI0028CFA7E8|nr:sigma-54 dependent transcriptional regulator [Tepidimonas sp.]MDT7928587.1 sigma-54 dependent transcriptional regulator [Tepidimonas sp.]
MARILIVDDDTAFCEGLAETLSDFGHEIIVAHNTESGLHRLRTEAVNLALVDLRLPGRDGLDFMRHARELAPGLPCIMLTAYASADNTIEAMRLGAFDHLCKPVARDALAQAVRKALQCAASVPRADEALDDRDVATDRYALVGASDAMRAVLKRIGQAAASDASVLVLGETGTGKELVARALHRHSARAAGPFVAVNCAAIPAELMESELFGHVRGAFTGAATDRSGRFRDADGGTLFLDEIGDMSLQMQAKMLRVLQEREVTPVGAARPVRVDVRIVAATHRDLAAMVAKGQFREDLWYRLQVVSILLPPLRERPGDVVLLAEHFLRLGGYGKTLSPQAARTLMLHSWPGNVRELRNVIERAAVMTPGSVIEPADLDLLAQTMAVGTPVGSGLAGVDLDGPLQPALAALERAMIERALLLCDGNRAEAARRLGLHRQQLYRKLEEFGLR